MIYVCYAGRKVIGFTAKFPFTGERGKFTPHVTPGTTDVKSRGDFRSHEEVVKVAAALTKLTGDHWVGTDAGEWVSPRYDVIEVPKVGDKVSYSFNGDSYPDGEIVKVSKTFQVTTSTGNVYRRKRNTGAWVKTGGVWCLIAGHISERNPHI